MQTLLKVWQFVQGDVPEHWVVSLGYDVDVDVDVDGI